MSAAVALPLLSAAERPAGLWEALAASCRLLHAEQAEVCFTGPLWQAEGRYLAGVTVEEHAERRRRRPSGSRHSQR